MMYRKFIYIIFFIFFWAQLHAQSPDMYPPTVPEPVDINLFNIVLYIVLPVTVIAVYFWYRKSKRKKEQKKKEQEKNQEKQ